MRMIRHGLAALVLLATVHVGPTHAAESYDNCTGVIETLPATISTQGTWCLKHDVATAITSGNAITIAANNVTLDCNDFKIGGLAAGEGSSTIGIYAADNRQNATVRHCGIRGFLYGVQLLGAGHLVEDNRLDHNLYVGIYVNSDNNRVQRNRVYDTGSLGRESGYGIWTSADVIDNTISGVIAAFYPVGIAMAGNGTEARGNQVRGVVANSGTESVGINVWASNITIDRNRISAEGPMGGKGVYAATNTFCTGNTVVHFATAYDGCDATVGDLSLP